MEQIKRNKHNDLTNKPYITYSPSEDFSDFEHIIIGSGIGGLTTALWLAKLGYKVAVLEQHYVPGGFTHVFKRKDHFQWDVGVHYVGNMQKGEGLRGLFDFLTDRKVEWESMGEIYDVVNIDNERFEFRAGEENQIWQLISYFPEEKEAILSYFKLIKKTNKLGSAFFFQKTFKPLLRLTLGRFLRKLYSKYSQKTTYEVISKLTQNQKLIAVLCAQCGNYGLAPKESSFAAHAMVVGHFMKGGYYPKGGASKIATSIIENINKNGGKVFINAKVDEIIVEKHSVKGIRIKDRVIPCKSVISNVGANNTFNFLLNPTEKAYCKVKTEELLPSTGHLCLYVGLNKSSVELRLPKHNVWNFANENYDKTLESLTLDNAVEAFSYISFPSAKDSEWQKQYPHKSTIQALTKANFDWFKEYETKPWMKRGEEYNQLKKDFEVKMLAKLYQLFPQLEGNVVVTEVSTPLSTQHFSGYTKGEIYGLEHTPNRFNLNYLRPETKIKGLRLVGQDITLVGVAGAMLSGMLCAITILKFRVWKIFKEIGTYS